MSPTAQRVSEKELLRYGAESVNSRGHICDAQAFSRRSLGHFSGVEAFGVEAFDHLGSAQSPPPPVLRLISADALRLVKSGTVSLPKWLAWGVGPQTCGTAR